MNYLNDWIPENLLNVLGWTLVHSLWQLTLVGGLLWILLKLFAKKSPDFKYNLALGTMVFTVILTLSTFVFQLSLTEKVLITGEWMESVGSISEASLGTFESSPQNIIQISSGWIESQLPLLVNFWFVGAVLFLVRLFTNFSELRSLRKTSLHTNDFQLDKSFYRLLGKLDINTDIDFRLTEGALSPITFGFLKPVILIPAGLVFHLSAEQLEAILAHELAHIKRNDYLTNFCQSFLEVLFFYHPSFWWMSQTIKELRENAADDMAVKAGISPGVLAHSLAEVLAFAKQNPPELALAAGQKRNPTLQRIKRILGHPAQTYPQNPIISIPMLLTLVLSAGLMASAQQDVSILQEEVKPIASLVVTKAREAKVKVIEKLDLDTEMPALIDTTIDVKKEVIVEQLHEVILEEGEDPAIMVWETNESLHSIKEGDSEKNLTYVFLGDTLYSGKDTIVMNDKKAYFLHLGHDFDFEEMPQLELPEPPEFDIEFGSGELMLEMPPVPVFEMEMGEFFSGSSAPMVFDMENFQGGNFFAFSDTTEMTKEERENMIRKMEKNSQKWAEEMEKNAAKWEKEMGPKMKEFEEKMKAWQKENEPKMKEFQKKMEEWQKAQEPKMKEFEEKMKAWQEEQQPKLEEFQRKMELWQKENEEKVKEFQKRLEESVEKKNN